VQRHGGYAVGIHPWRGGASACVGGRLVIASDIGWVVGHSSRPSSSATTIAEVRSTIRPRNALGRRGGARLTRIFTSPTAVRGMRYGEPPGTKPLSLDGRLCRQVLNAPAWEWLQKRVFDDRVPVIDHMWQTETGGPVFGNPYGLAMLPIKPGSATLPLPGIDAAVVNPTDGKVCEPGEKGIMVIRRPFPGLTPALWGEPERYAADYWQRIPEVYYTGDSAHVDEDGYVFFAGRADEIIKCAGHRLGTIEVETALLTHPAVAEAGVTGRPDELRGEVISAFVALRQGHQPSQALREELLQAVRREMGPVAVVADLNFVHSLPKTRSGKIMRRVFKAVILERDPGDITTIEDEGSVDEARRAWSEMRRELAEAQAGEQRRLH
jgi:acetyl-CoA synthetase